MKRNRKKRPHYDDEFKRDTVNLHIKSGKTIHQFATEMGISDNSLINWRKKYLSEDTAVQQTASERIAQLEQELKNVTEERDILKKSVAIFLKPQK